MKVALKQKFEIWSNKKPVQEKEAHLHYRIKISKHKVELGGIGCGINNVDESDDSSVMT